MKRVYLLAGVLAIVTGVLVYTFCTGLQRSASAAAASPAEKTVSVVEAAADIPAYTQLSSDNLVTVAMPASACDGLALDIADAEGSYYTTDLVAGERLMASKIVSLGDGGGKGGEDGSGSQLSYSIPDGMRAITVATDAVTGVDENIVIGDHVDVYSTVASSEDGQVSIAVAQNVEVIGLASAAGADGATSYTNVTLLADAATALSVMQADNTGTLRLALRGVTDNSASAATSVATSDLLEGK